MLIRIFQAEEYSAKFPKLENPLLCVCASEPTKVLINSYTVFKSLSHLQSCLAKLMLQHSFLEKLKAFEIYNRLFLTL